MYTNKVGAPTLSVLALALAAACALLAGCNSGARPPAPATSGQPAEKTVAPPPAGQGSTAPLKPGESSQTITKAVAPANIVATTTTQACVSSSGSVSQVTTTQESVACPWTFGVYPPNSNGGTRAASLELRMIDGSTTLNDATIIGGFAFSLPLNALYRPVRTTMINPIKPSLMPGLANINYPSKVLTVSLAPSSFDLVVATCVQSPNKRIEVPDGAGGTEYIEQGKYRTFAPDSSGVWKWSAQIDIPVSTGSGPVFDIIKSVKDRTGVSFFSNENICPEFAGSIPIPGED